VEADEPSGLTQVLRDLPRKRLAIVGCIVLLNVCLAACWRGSNIAHERARDMGPSACLGGHPHFPVPPWDWTADEWREMWALK